MSFNTNIYTNPTTSTTSSRLLISTIIAFTSIVALTIFQDLIESHRSGYAFYLSESLLFKITWFLFIPFLSILYIRLSREPFITHHRTILYIAIPVLVHYLVFPFIARGFSVIFYGGRYDLYKFFSYTLAHDLYKLVIIYSGFVLMYQYFQRKNKSSEEIPNTPHKIIINNGKDNTIINVEDIYHITAATPYIYIHSEHKKHLHSQTLKSILATLDPNTFIRVHKSVVVNISKICSFKSRLNGDYDLLLTNGDSVRLSRTYAADFKKHFTSSPQDNT